jgi:hypothetical protein
MLGFAQTLTSFLLNFKFYTLYEKTGIISTQKLFSTVT